MKASQDTDETPVTLDIPLGELRAIDERPYAEAIPAGVRVVMTSWAVYPALDSSGPAGLSTAVIQGELRGRLGFRGVSITDSLGATALDGFGTYANRGVLAVRAGADLILCSAQDVAENSPTVGEAVLRSLARELGTGSRARQIAEAAAMRVLHLRLQT